MNSDNNGFKETLQLYNLCTQKKCRLFNCYQSFRVILIKSPLLRDLRGFFISGNI